ncbi:serine hydrolase [Candidatus Uhrbacteria bacterium]|nr:serine hydrolase [Candidatus Uhrbacteria bacterium]
MFQRGTSALVGALVILSFMTGHAGVAAEYAPQENEFASAVVMRPDGKLLYGFKPDAPHTAASLSKLVTALVFLDKSWNWGTAVKMSSADEVGGGRLRVTAGSRVILADLWQSSLGSSANNATMAIARLAGPGISAFVNKMNAKVKAIGATSSTFRDPSGMNPKNTTTAHDMALIARNAFKQPKVVSASQSGTYTFTLAGSTNTHTIKNTNAPMLADPDVYLVGGKTGYLPESMYNYTAMLSPLVGDGKSRDAKKDVVVVVLGAKSTQGAMDSAKRLAEWAWADEDHFKQMSQYPVPMRSLYFGLSGDDVRWVQERLDIKPINGNFGPSTKAAVQKFQVAQGLAKAGNSGYGVVGPATRSKLIELAP